MRDQFLVCGEALFDLFVKDKIDGSLECNGVPGGSPFNVAIGLARLEEKVSFLGGISEDVLGSRLIDKLRQEKVGTDEVRRYPAPTTLSIIKLDGSGVPQYAFYGNGASDRLLDGASLPAKGGWQAIHIGSYSTVVQPIATTLRLLVERESPQCIISYDPNVRLNVEPSIDVWKTQLQSLLPYVHLLKISEEDLHLIYGDEEEAMLVQNWLDAGVELVVITRGGNGAQAWNKTGSTSVAGLKVAVVDTVGAGDTVQAALLSWLSRRGALSPNAMAALTAPELEGLLIFAMTAASITCSRRGADMARREEVIIEAASSATIAPPN